MQGAGAGAGTGGAFDMLAAYRLEWSWLGSEGEEGAGSPFHL